MNIENDTQVTAERQWPVTLKLNHPVVFGSETIDTLTFRRGRLGDLKGVSVAGIPPTEQLIVVASRMCGQPQKVIESLDVDDVGPVLDVIVSFFARCLETGKRA